MDHQQCGQKKKQNLRWNNNLGEPRYSGSQESQTNSDNLNLLKTRLPSMTDRYQSHHTETKLHSIATSFTLVNATFLESEENMRRIDKKKAIMKQTSSVVKLKLFSDGQPVARIQWWTAFRPTESLIKVYLSICLLWWTGFSQILWIPVLPNCFVQDYTSPKKVERCQCLIDYFSSVCKYCVVDMLIFSMINQDLKRVLLCL